jgi:hypothetical protein
MFTSSEQWVPKVHPTARELGPEDPMELVASAVQGDPAFMLQCLIQEFAWLGWEADQLLGLFHHPAYPVLNQLLDYFGVDAVRQRIQELVGQAGVIHFRESIDEESEPEADDAPVLLQVSTRKISQVHGHAPLGKD